ncbi:MAG: AIM24 family protein, partial [Verrucomicrobia bacterium]|nr:AIM24 family protein [Verrucomicrobiota bacterium]
RVHQARHRRANAPSAEPRKATHAIKKSPKTTELCGITKTAAGGTGSNVKLTGSGLIAFTSHGPPLTLIVSPSHPLTCDPNATVAWSAGLKTELKSAVTLKTLIGRGTGETFQQRFSGEGIVVVQPYEEVMHAGTR